MIQKNSRGKERKKMECSNVSRRGFLKAGFGLGAVATASGLALNLTKGEAHAAGPVPKKWDETYDVVVIGSGFAGLSAAIEAKNAGSTVIVLEKMPVHGGNSIINGGDFCAAGTKMQKEAGINDSADLMLKDMLKAGLYLNNPELAKIVADQSRDALDWSQNYLGAHYIKLNFHGGGHSVKRAHQTANASGSELVNKMFAKVKVLGVNVQTRTKLARFIVNNEKRVVGVEVSKGIGSLMKKPGNHFT